MRAGPIVVLVVAAAVVGGGALVATGHLPQVERQWGTLASAWTAGPGDAGPADAGADAAVKAQAAPLSSAQLSAPLYHATFIAGCGAPADMKVVLTATVKLGRAVDVKATTDPPDPTIEVCIENAARDLRWDASKKTDKVTVRY
jgi:hypothetical protein